MCVIVGYIGNKSAASVLEAGLVKLEYNGGGGGIQGNDALRLELAADATQKIELFGDWKYHSRKRFSSWS